MIGEYAVFLVALALAVTAAFLIGYVWGHEAGIRYTYFAANVKARRLAETLREATKWLSGCLDHLGGTTHDRVKGFLSRAAVTLDFTAEPIPVISEEARQP